MAISVAGRTITFFLITVAFALYLTVSLSIPVTSKLYFLSYQFNNVKGLKIGLWGSCTYDIVNGVYSAGTCTKSKVGFLVDMRGFPGRSNAAFPYVVGNLASALIMYPLAAVFSFFTMVLCIVKGDKAMDTVGLAAILGQAAMIISFILFERTDNQIRQGFTPGVITGGLGNCLWIGLAACLLAGICSLTAFCATSHKTRVHGSLINKV